LLILVFGPAVITLPWIVRNYVVFERLIFIRGNLGLELHVSNNPCAEFGVRMNQRTGCFQTIHPNVNAVQARKLVAMGEPAYQHEQLSEAIEWIQHHPQRFIALTAQRFWFFWFPSNEGNNLAELLSQGWRRSLRAIVVYSATILSLPGLLLLFARNRPGGLICLLWLGSFPIIHYIVQFEPRYRSPILWLTLLLAGFTIATLLQRLALADSGDRSGEADGDAGHTVTPKSESNAARSVRGTERFPAQPLSKATSLAIPECPHAHLASTFIVPTWAGQTGELSC
jgi:hypothetical protein